MKKLQEDLEQVRQEMAHYKRLAESAAGGGPSSEGSFDTSGGGGLLGRRKKTSDETFTTISNATDSGTWKVGGGVIGTIKRKASPRPSARPMEAADTGTSVLRSLHFPVAVSPTQNRFEREE